MKVKKHIAILLSAGVIISGAVGAYSAHVSKPMIVSAAYEAEISRVVELVNEKRAEKGIAPLATATQLTKAAQARAKELGTNFSFMRPNGMYGITIVTEYNVMPLEGSENIAYGQKTPEEVIDAWATDSEQLARMLNSNYHYMGVGVEYSNGVFYWVQIFVDRIGKDIPIETVTTPETTTTTPETTTTTSTSTTTTTTSTTTTETTTSTSTSTSTTTTTTPEPTETTTTSTSTSTTTTTTTTTPEPTETTTTSTSTTSEPTETTEPVQPVVYGLGDVNYNNEINAQDAALILQDSAMRGANGWGIFGDDQLKRSDLNRDGVANAGDAAMVLEYAAYLGAGGTKTIYEYFHIA